MCSSELLYAILYMQVFCVYKIPACIVTHRVFWYLASLIRYFVFTITKLVVSLPETTRAGGQSYTYIDSFDRHISALQYNFTVT